MAENASIFVISSFPSAVGTPIHAMGSAPACLGGHHGYDQSHNILQHIRIASAWTGVFRLRSTRLNRVFIRVSCAAISQSLIAALEEDPGGNFGSTVPARLTKS